MPNLPVSDTRPDALKLALARRGAELELCRRDPSHYIFKYVRTKDEHDANNPIKQFPRKEYLEHLLNTWHNGNPVEFLIKSRQLMVSWLAVAYISWVARFHNHRLIFVQSKKEEDAANLVFNTHPSQARLSFIETHLPEWMQNVPVWAYGKAIYDNGSRVQAIPQGPTHYESYVPSLVFNDEASLQDEWMAGHAALKPCIEGGGRCITVATVRMPSSYSEEMREGEKYEPLMHGMHTFRSQSGVSSTALHYSADPDKNPETDKGGQWYASATDGYPGGTEGHLWRQHMEMDFEALSGTQLFPYFDKCRKYLVAKAPPRNLQLGWRYFGGFDYGKRNRTAFGVYALSPEGKQYWLWELVAPGEELGGIPGIVARMKRCPYWEDVRHSIRADPSMWNDNQAKLGGGYTSISQLFAIEGVGLQKSPLKGQNADDIGIERLQHFYWADPYDPLLTIDPQCVEHIRQFKSLRYQEWTVAVQGTRSLKETLVDRDNDTWDAWKYSECARPSPARLTRKAPSGSFESQRRNMLKLLEKRPGPLRVAR